MSQQSHPVADVSAVTPAQRAQILREELIWFEKKWDRTFAFFAPVCDPPHP